MAVKLESMVTERLTEASSLLGTSIGFNEVLTGTYHHLFYPAQLISGKEDAANNCLTSEYLRAVW
jgi:hypothetical protein